MNALILAAGRGRRLWPYTSDRPKCLLPLGDRSILGHQLTRLDEAGFRRATVVAGFGLEAVRHEAATVPTDLCTHVAYNPFYDVSDNLISLWSARTHIHDDVVVLNGDNVFHPDILTPLMGPPPADVCLLVQRRENVTDDDMKVQLQGDRLACIGKELSHADAVSIGIMRFSGAGARALHDVLEQAVRGDDALGHYYLDCVQRLVDDGMTVECRDTGALPWSDIDTPADLDAVRTSLSSFEAGPKATPEPLRRAAP